MPNKWALHLLTPDPAIEGQVLPLYMYTNDLFMEHIKIGTPPRVTWAQYGPINIGLSVMQACRSLNWLHFKVETVGQLSALKLGSSVDLNELGELQKQASMFQKILESHLQPFLTSS